MFIVLFFNSDTLEETQIKTYFQAKYIHQIDSTHLQ